MAISDKRPRIFIYDIVLSLVLVALAAGYLVVPAVHSIVPNSFRLILHSPWFGTMGGIVISLKGVYDHRGGQAPGWDEAFDLWHLGRPVSGGIVGFMTLVLLYSINAGKEPSPSVVYAAAFVLGTQERRFFNFLYEVARLILQVPQEQENTALAATEIQPSQGHQDDVIIVRGRGFTLDVTLLLGDKQVQALRVSSDGTAIGGRAPAPATAGAVDVVVQKPDGARAVLPHGFTYQ